MVPRSIPDTASHPDTEPLNSLQSPADPQVVEGDDIDNLGRATMDLSIESPPDSSVSGDESHSPGTRPSGLGATKLTPEAPLYDDPSTDRGGGQGEWITPDNVALYKSRALKLLPSSGGDLKKRRRVVDDQAVLAGCMTADFAIQNVLLQMGLTLVGTEGKRIQKVKTWVLRCHACFK